MVDLLVSSMSGPGGIFRIADGRAVQVNDIPTSGVAVLPSGLYRSRFSREVAVIDRMVRDGEQWVPAETWDVPGAAHPHDICEHDGLLAMADTLHDRVVWLDPSTGAVAKEWQATILGDAWHINTLTVQNGVLLASIFGKFDIDRGWWGSGAEKRGEVIEVGTGEVVLSGLSAPHSPVRWQGRWLVLNTFEGELTLMDDESTRLGSVELGGWPNGMRMADDMSVWVGISDSHRKPFAPAPHGNTPGKVVRVSLAHWQASEEIVMPCSSVYNIIETPEA